MRAKGPIFLALFLSCAAPLKADLNGEMNRFFSNYGSAANVDRAEIYDGQKAGYLTGGGVTIRNRVMDTRLLTVNLPRFDAGCGGIDIYLGGFSFINKEQLVDTLKAIGSSAIGYSFMLGLETVSPQITNTIKQLQTWANNINSMGINSCEVAAQLVGSVWPRNTMASQQICRDMGGQSGSFSDYVSSRHNCAQRNEYDRMSGMMDQDPRYKTIIRDEYNIAWEAIQKQGFLSQNRDMAEFFMSLMGTVIVRRGEQLDVETWPSKIHDESFLHALLEGGTAKGYRCPDTDKGKCLVIEESVTMIKEAQSWVGRIKSLLVQMQNKILSDQELNEEEKELLAKTRLPVYRIVNVLTAYKKGFCPIDLYQVSDVIAMDLLIQYLREAVEAVRQGANQLKRGQMYGDAVDQYLNELSRVEKAIRYYETRAMHQMDREFQMMTKLQTIEQQIAAEITI